MRRFLGAVLAVLLPLAPLSAQSFNVPGGGSGAAISGTPAATNTAQWTNPTTIKGVAQGVINVRTMYGAVPDGSTDNATAITNAFTASNAYAVGIPTIYFDCDTGSTTCQYNYSGSGTSAINPTRTTTIQCAIGVSLNYTGSAHAVDLGATGLSAPDELPYRIQGCQFTGAASSTQGIYINSYITNTYINDNVFFNFGNRTGFNIYYAGNNWEGMVSGNSWFDHDGVTRNMLDGHNAAVHAIRIIGNNSECATAINTACSIVAGNLGVGLWIGDEFKVTSNVIQYHAPLIRLANTASANSDRPSIIGNHFEGNTNSPSPAITFGDPGGTGSAVGCMTFSGNTLFYPAATGIPIIGPETAGSSSYSLSNCPIENNDWTAPSSGTYYVNTNFGVNNIWGRNQVAGTLITVATTSPSVFDFNSRNYFSVWLKKNGGSNYTGVLSVQTDQTALSAGPVDISSPLACTDATGSGTTQTCSTGINSTQAGGNMTPVAGTMIIYKTTTTNTGDLTISVNAQGAKNVRKFGGNVVLAAGDIVAGVYNLLVYDGTFWEMSLPYPKRPGYTVATLPSTAATGQVIGAQAYVTDAVACTFLATLTGGGSTWCPVGYSGAAWVGE